MIGCGSFGSPHVRTAQAVKSSVSVLSQSKLHATVLNCELHDDGQGQYTFRPSGLTIIGGTVSPGPLYVPPEPPGGGGGGGGGAGLGLTPKLAWENSRLVTIRAPITRPGTLVRDIVVVLSDWGRC